MCLFFLLFPSLLKEPLSLKVISASKIFIDVSNNLSEKVKSKLIRVFGRNVS